MRGDIAGMRAAAHDIRRPHQHIHSVLARSLRGGQRGRKFGDHAAKLVGFGDMFMSGVVVAGESDLAFPAHRGDSLAIRLRPGRRQRHLLLFEAFHLLAAELIFALIIFAIFFAVGELALTRRVVHQRHQGDRLAVDQLFKQRQSGVVRQFTAQMQAVLGAVKPAFLRLFHRVDHLFQILKAVAAVAHVANRHGVEYGGDAAGDHQSIVAAHRRVCRPVNLWPRGEEFIQVIGMEFDKPRQQPAAFAIEGAGQSALALGKGVNPPLLHFQ